MNEKSKFMKEVTKNLLHEHKNTLLEMHAWHENGREKFNELMKTGVTYYVDICSFESSLRALWRQCELFCLLVSFLLHPCAAECSPY